MERILVVTSATVALFSRRRGFTTKNNNIVVGESALISKLVAMKEAMPKTREADVEKEENESFQV